MIDAFTYTQTPDQKTPPACRFTANLTQLSINLSLDFHRPVFDLKQATDYWQNPRNVSISGL